MRTIVVEARGETSAPPQAVYSLLKDSNTWPKWSRIGSCRMSRPGRTELHAVGARRIFRTWPLKLEEEIVELIPDRRASYVVLSGLPMRDYRADTDLEPAASGGTIITWRSSFHPTIPGTSWLLRAFMAKILRDMVADLTAVAADPVALAAIAADEPARSVPTQLESLP